VLRGASYEEAVCNDKAIQRIFLFYILSIILQDLPLQLPLGTIAKSPYVFFSPIVFILITALCFRLYFEKEVRYYLLYYLYSISIAIFLIMWYVGLNGYSMYVYGEHLVLKFLKSSTYNLIIILTFYNLIFILRFSTLEFIEKTLKILVLAQLFVGLVQLVVPTAFDVIKTPQYLMTDRLTLLSSEPSQAFPQLLVSYLCYLGVKFYRRSKLMALDYVIVVVTFIFLILIQSKGGLIMMLLCLIMIVLLTKQTLKNKLKLFAGSLLFMAPIFWLLVTVTIPILLIDMEKSFGTFTSVSTRAITILSALQSLITYPFGQGYSTYLITFPYLLDRTLGSVIASSGLPIPTYELDWMIGTGRALTVKSGLLNETLYSGWAIIIFYFVFFRASFLRLNLLRANKLCFIVFQFILLFIIINYPFVTNLETSYIAFLPFALLIRFNYEDKKHLSLG
jgi:hypothetical protein